VTAGRVGSRRPSAEVAGIFVQMANTDAAEIQVVAATDGETTHYWAAAVPRDRAASAVQAMLGAGWTATLTNKLLTPDQVSSLNLRAGDLRELREAP
jgi:hypothetical protein